MEIGDKTIEVFCCYARNDQLYLDELKKHLSALEREKLISFWADVNINAGANWEEEIHRHLNTAQIILLLVSPDFIASEYCYGIEMQRAMQRHERGEVCVIPIILRPVSWQRTPFGKLQAMPKDAQPITRWQDRDEAYFDITEGIRQNVEKLLRLSSVSRDTLSALPSPAQHAPAIPSFVKNAISKGQSEKFPHLRQIEATQKAESKSVSLTQPATTEGTYQILQSLWSKINISSQRTRVAGWLCFIALTLIIGLNTLFFIYHDPDMIGSKGDYGTVALSVSVIGAILVGLVFPLTKKRTLIDVIGGSALAAFGSLVLLTYLSGTVALCLEGTNAYVNFSYYSQNCFPFQIPGLSYPVPILFLSFLMLSIGEYVFLRRINTIGGFIFGILLILEIFLQRALLYSYSETGILNPNSGPPIVPSILSLIWIPPVILGSIAIVITILKILRSKRRTPNQIF